MVEPGPESEQQCGGREGHGQQQRNWDKRPMGLGEYALQPVSFTKHVGALC